MNQHVAHLWAFSALIAADAEAGKLHPRHLQILAAVCAAPEPMPVSAVAQLLGIDHAGLSRHALRLVGRGLLTRAEDPTDRRSTVLAPTAAGRALDARVQSAYTITAPAA